MKNLGYMKYYKSSNYVQCFKFVLGSILLLARMVLLTDEIRLV